MTAPVDNMVLDRTVTIALQAFTNLLLVEVHAMLALLGHIKDNMVHQVVILALPDTFSLRLGKPVAMLALLVIGSQAGALLRVELISRVTTPVQLLQFPTTPLSALRLPLLLI